MSPAHKKTKEKRPADAYIQRYDAERAIGTDSRVPIGFEVLYAGASKPRTELTLDAVTWQNARRVTILYEYGSKWAKQAAMQGDASSDHRKRVFSRATRRSYFSAKRSAQGGRE